MLFFGRCAWPTSGWQPRQALLDVWVAGLQQGLLVHKVQQALQASLRQSGQRLLSPQQLPGRTATCFECLERPVDTPCSLSTCDDQPGCLIRGGAAKHW